MTPNIAWTPSAARTIAPLAWSPAITDRGLPWSLFDAIPLEWPHKPSAALLDYTLDISSWLNDASDSISTVAPPTISTTMNADDLGLVWSTRSGPGVTMALSGGVPGTIYTVGIRVTTTLGRIGYWSVQIPINYDSPAEASQPPSNPPGVAFLPNGTALFVPSNLPTGSMQIPGAAYLNGGVLTTDAAPDNSAAAVPNFEFANLPTVDPGISGRLWGQSGPVRVSDGPIPPQTPLDVYFSSLPTTDPLVLNAPWVSGDLLAYSAGPT